MSFRKFILVFMIILNLHVRKCSADSDFFLGFLLLSPIYLTRSESNSDNWYKSYLICTTCIGIASIIHSYYTIQKNLSEIDLIKAKMDLNKSIMVLRKLKADSNNIITEN